MLNLPILKSSRFSLCLLILVALALVFAGRYWWLKRQEVVWFLPEEIGGGFESEVPRPEKLETEARPNSILVKWKSPDIASLQRFKLYRMKLEGRETKWKLLAQIKARGTQEWYEFEDRSVQPDAFYAYGVVVVNTEGGESDLLESYPISLKQ